ncbi:GerAB/ArcD/ProY family transporter [Clostridium magnum]|uniref:Spore germination protein YndE n=1 Tax=Clostridium magnum DSM 2767 TaxID=1121326 RepID=A0A161WCY0_9CLOT|nr:GerAB/ArcD/ProY family transporter [Clostridium magnum]KZL89545.1 spore germination protein YndE [Clostridium magnum DSM 2767]SHH71867.1 spore germination protein (amino acid permease) [Clostridium magnum DSM 2767]
MDKYEDSYITPSQLTLILVGSMIGIGVLTLPLGVIKDAKQDGWMSSILGTVYAMYFILLAQYMHKKFPEQNILILSEKYCGKFLGTIFNLIFLMFFLLLLTEAAAGGANMLMIYMTPFLSRQKILITMLLIPAFVAYKGIKTVARMNEVIFYSTLIVFFIPIAALKEGSILNIMPVFGSGIINIIKSTKETMLSYNGVEILLLIYPFFKDNKKIKKCGIVSTVITSIIYTWFVFSAIFYLGIDIIPKFLWPIITVTEAVTIPIINSFRYIFMSLWTLIIFRLSSNSYYTFTFGLNQISKSVSRKSFVLLMYPLIFYLSTLYQNPTIRRSFVDKIIPIYSLYNVIYVGIIALLITIRKGEKCEEKLQP